MPTPPEPKDLIQLVLEHFFGKASIVVFMFVIATFVLAWISATRATLAFGTLARRFFDYSADKFDAASGKMRSTMSFAMSWLVFYLLASFATQIWAGSSFSPGQGNGIAELLTWSALFGALSVVGCVVLLPPDYGSGTVKLAIGVGWLIGLGYAVWWFSIKGGPKPGDWWVAPASSCALVLTAASSARLAWARGVPPHGRDREHY